jgi:hypothetical protein
MLKFNDLPFAQRHGFKRGYAEPIVTADNSVIIERNADGRKQTAARLPGVRQGVLRRRHKSRVLFKRVQEPL